MAHLLFNNIQKLATINEQHTMSNTFFSIAYSFPYILPYNQFLFICSTCLGGFIYVSEVLHTNDLLKVVVQTRRYELLKDKTG